MLRAALGPPVLLLLLALTPVAAAAPVLTPITSRNFDVDLSVTTAAGAARTVAMGGTSTALSEGAAGLLGNPGAAAVRPLSARGTWDWDLGVSEFVSDLGNDFDNNGVASDASLEAHLATVALLGYYRAWALGVSVVSVSYPRFPASPTDPTATATATLGAALARLVLARTFLGEALGIGVGLRAGDLSLDTGDGTAIFASNGLTAEAGLVHAPHGASWRGGVAFALPVSAQIEADGCNPDDCRGYILPTRAVAPWELSLGAAYRFGPTPWNDPPAGRFRDEPATVVAADLVLTGMLANAGGLEAFTAHQMQRSGQRLALSGRLGAEREWVPGRLRVRLGGYWERARFAGVPGRPHGTGGLEVRLFRFDFWGAERRVALSAALDLARHYGNIGLSLGFWH